MQADQDDNSSHVISDFSKQNESLYHRVKFFVVWHESLFRTLLTATLIILAASVVFVYYHPKTNQSLPQPKLSSRSSTIGQPALISTKSSASNGNTQASTSHSGVSNPPVSVSTGSGSNSPPAQTVSHTWIMTKSAFDSIISDQEAATRLKQDTIYLIGGAPVAGYDIIPTLDFQDETKLAGMIASRAPYVEAVLYDDEDWSNTPSNQQTNFAYYYQQAAALAHQNGLRLVGTPALDLVSSLNPGTSGDSNDVAAYLSDDIAYDVAKYADVFDIQSQRLIQDQSLFTSFISQASTQAKTANPSEVVLAGLSTCAGSPTAGQIAGGAIVSNSYVSGWWMNVPGSANAPGCTPKPSLAIQAIDALPWY